MRVIELRTILEHLPDDAEVQIAGRGPCGQVRHPEAQRWVTPGVFLDVGDGCVVRGRFRERRTLAVRLEGLAS